LAEKLPPAVLPYQREGFAIALQRGGRVLFGDEMGLGKSLQALMTIDYYAEDLPCLIVCPSSLRFGWRDQVQKWLGDADGTGTIKRLVAKDLRENHRSNMMQQKEPPLILNEDILAEDAKA
ncbi:unnamed protein product, partial [Amoebophrya sp. A120]